MVHAYVHKAKRLEPHERAILIESAKAALELAEQIELAVWDFVKGTCILGYEFVFTVPAQIILALGIGLLWMIARDAVVYCTLAIGYMVQGVLTVIADVINALNAVDSAGASVVSSISKDFGGPSVHAPTISVPSPADILGSWYSTMIAVDTTCLAMDTWLKVITAMVSFYLSDVFCNTIRYMYPVEFVFFILVGMLQWATMPPAPFPSENCQAGTGEELCMWLNFYLVIFYLIIPAIIIKTFIISYKDLIWRVLDTWLVGTIKHFWHVYRAETRKNK